MCLNDVSNALDARVPSSVQVVGHNVEPVNNRLHAGDVETLEVPI